MIVHRVRTGGQTGVDQAAWRAAKATGFATCGIMPSWFRTLGPGGWGEESHPEFADLYGATCSSSSAWEVRTRENVIAATAVVLLGDPVSVGSKLTVTTAINLGRPLVWVPNAEFDSVVTDHGWVRDVLLAKFVSVTSPIGLAEWITICDVPPGDLMVSGNRERDSPPTIGPWAEAFLIETFNLLRARP